MGYGNLHDSCRRKLVATHRLSWELHNGPIPDGMFVLHKCDVPKCVNPDHLFLGTNDDNVRDMVSKGRACDQRGERNGRSKLTDDDVREVRRRYAAGESQQRVADDFGVNQTMVGFIVRRVRWSHVA